MESRKNKVLRVVNVIYDIKPGVIVEVVDHYAATHIFKCECIDGNYDLYHMNEKHNSWGMSCDTLYELRDALLRDFIDGVLLNIRIRVK